MEGPPVQAKVLSGPGVLDAPAHVLCCTDAPRVQATCHRKSHTGDLSTRRGTIAPSLESKGRDLWLWNERSKAPAR